MHVSLLSILLHLIACKSVTTISDHWLVSIRCWYEVIQLFWHLKIGILHRIPIIILMQNTGILVSVGFKQLMSF